VSSSRYDNNTLRISSLRDICIDGSAICPEAAIEPRTLPVIACFDSHRETRRRRTTFWGEKVGEIDTSELVRPDGEGASTTGSSEAGQPG
jgi:hypothetical protein